MEDAVIAQEEMDRLSEIGRAIYQRDLAPILEPSCNGQSVAIHLDTGDYEVGTRAARPAVRLRLRHPEGGMIMVTDIGPTRSDDMLAFRMQASRLSAGSRK